jgi:hypothetical protein
MQSEMTKYTPGPWKVIDGDQHDHVFAEEFPNKRICNVFSGLQCPSGAANARLIAAAPELLEACRAAMRILPLWGGNDCPEDDHLFEENKALFMMQQKFIEAIAKAEGGA